MSRDVGLSVVVAASWSASAARRTVASIGEMEEVEVVVASDPARVAPAPLPGRARWVVGGPGDGVPRLRRLGFKAARGRVVAFVEDACVVGPGWASAVLAGFRDDDCLAVTGPVVQGDGASATDWGVYFAEYAAFSGLVGDVTASPHPTLPRKREGSRKRPSRPSGPLPPCGGGLGWGVAGVPSCRLAGINFACRREILAASPTIREAELSARLAGSTRAVDATVVHVRRYGFRGALADRWRFGREFGRERWDDRPGPLRRLGPAAAPAILGVQLARLGRSVVGNPRLAGPLLRALPATLALLTAWSAGEALGWAEACLPSSRRRGKAARPPASGPALPVTEPGHYRPKPADA